jgi:hypothetical protein
MANNYTKILELANKNNMGLSNTIKRDYGIPLDYSSVQESYEAALAYAKTSTLAYIGQPISVGDVLYVVTTAENGYLKQVGTKPVGDNKSIQVSEDGVVSICGFSAAEGATLPQKQADGTIKWVAISAIVEGDGNTKSVVKAADGSDITVTPVYDEVNDTYTYTLDVKFPAIPAYSVEKVAGENDVTYKVTKDGVQVGESIVVPNAFDASDILESINVIEGYFTNGVANSAAEAKDYVADGAIGAEFKRLGELINGLAGVDTTFTQELETLQNNFNAFMEGSSADDVINTLVEIRGKFEELQSHTSVYEEKVDQNAEDIEAIKGRLDAVEAIEHHAHDNKAELDKIADGDVAKWNSLENYDDSAIRETLNTKAEKNYVDAELAKKVDKDGYIAFTQAEKDKLAGLENYNDTAIVERIAAVEGNFTEGKANDAVKFGGQLPEYYATKTSVEDAIAGVHSHDNKKILDGITAEEVTAWDNAEQNAKTFAESEIAKAKTELAGVIADEQSRAEGIEAGLDTRIQALEAKEPTKVEKSNTNGSIKVDGTEVKVYDDSTIASRVKNVEDNYVEKSTLENYFTKGETETRISEMIADINGGESAGEVLAQLNAYKTVVSEKNEAQDALIKKNTDAITVLNGDGEGSVSKQVSDAIAAVVADAPEALDTLKEIADYIAGDKTNAAELLNKINANTTAIADEKARAESKEAELAALIQSNTGAIAVLNGDGEGSVNKKIADAISAIPAIPAATASALGLVKIGETMSVTADGTINVAKVSTDILVQGENELVLMGGSAK